MTVMNACFSTAGPIPELMPGLADRKAEPTKAADAARAAQPPDDRASLPRPLHRLGDVRRREGITRRTVARRLGISIHQVQQQEERSSDLSLSELYRWQEALRVPAAELLSELDGQLSPPVHLRARLLRLMKTVRSIQDVARQASVRRFIQFAYEQLLDIMPELNDITAWPSVGARNQDRELGQAFLRRIDVDSRGDWDDREAG